MLHYLITVPGKGIGNGLALYAANIFIEEANDKVIDDGHHFMAIDIAKERFAHNTASK